MAHGARGSAPGAATLAHVKGDLAIAEAGDATEFLHEMDRDVRRAASGDEFA